MNRLVNLRDLGGLPLVQGGQTRSGMLYRSDTPHQDDIDPDDVPHWPPATVVDLRMEREAELTPYELRGSERILYPLHAGAAPQNIRDKHIGVLYSHILDTAASRVAAAVDIVVTRPGPALVHCTAGKDRTGIVVASLLLSAGVAPDDVVADYVKTSEHVDKIVARIALRQDLTKYPISEAWLQTPAEAMAAVVTKLTSSEYGDAQAWLTEHGTNRDALDDWVGRFTEGE